MKKRLICVWIGVLTILPLSALNAQDPITLIIKEGIIKVIQAVDLKVQRLQNKTIWLQNAQKLVENKMAQQRLGEITDWVEKQRVLYKEYFEELQNVKSALTSYQKVREITHLQLALVRDYKRAYDVVKKDSHFSSNEIVYIGKVYTGILEESLRNLEGLTLVINAFTTQMTDAERLEMINRVYEAIQGNYNDVKRFTAQNVQLSSARAKDHKEAERVKALYGF